MVGKNHAPNPLESKQTSKTNPTGTIGSTQEKNPGYIQGVVANGKAGIGALGEKVVEDVKKMKWEIPTKIDKTQFSKAVSRKCASIRRLGPHPISFLAFPTRLEVKVC